MPYVISETGEQYSSEYVYNDKLSAIADGIQEFDGNEFYVGEVDEFKPEIDVEYLLDKIRNQAHDFAEGVVDVDDWLGDVSNADEQELQQELQKVFNNWMMKHDYQPKFFLVHDEELVSPDDGGSI